jgi:hypothetical protein
MEGFIITRYFITYNEGDFIYVEYTNGERRRCNLISPTSKEFESIPPAYTFSEKELYWIKSVLDKYGTSPGVSASYTYLKNKQAELRRNKEEVKRELDRIRFLQKKFTPEELKRLKSHPEREKEGYKDFSGIYVIYNTVRDKYYIGQAKRVFERVHKHFIESKGNPGVYSDYVSGDKFLINLLPIRQTCFSDLNELETNAISAYDSYKAGYNETPGNILDKPIFKHKDYEHVAELILDRVKDTQLFTRLTNKRDRISYARRFLAEYNLPPVAEFYLPFADKIKDYKQSLKNIN